MSPYFLHALSSLEVGKLMMRYDVWHLPNAKCLSSLENPARTVFCGRREYGVLCWFAQAISPNCIAILSPFDLLYSSATIIRGWGSQILD
jgi:hypothetical protein